MEDFRDRVLMLMKEKGLNKKELAALSGLKQSTLYSVFSKRIKADNVTVDTIRALANALGVTMDYLIEGKEPSAEELDTITIYGRGVGAEVYKINEQQKEIIRMLLKQNTQDK